MSGNKKSFITNPWYIFFACLALAAAVGFVMHLLKQNWIPAAAGTYAILNHIFSNARTKRLKTEFNTEKINILKRVCRDKIGLARSLSNNYNDRSLIYCLIELEFLVTEMTNCCDSDEDKKKFKKVKGLLGSTKTTFDKCNFDDTINRPYSDVIECVSELETYLNDI